jgi:uncharacterized protein GlcG (DUF336 family)
MGMLSLERAQEIIHGALKKARELNMEPMTVVIVDASGTIKASAREDGAGILRPDMAFAKAWGAVGMGLPTRELLRRQNTSPQFFNALHSISAGRLVANPGGVLIIADSVLIGAVGVTGDTGDNDEIIAVAGILEAGFEADHHEGAAIRHSPL